jgi:hypothetical protein
MTEFFVLSAFPSSPDYNRLLLFNYITSAATIATITNTVTVIMIDVLAPSTTVLL